MANFWATLSIWAAGSLALLTFLDWALTNQQKKWVTDRAIALFVWLDDQKELTYLKYLGKFRWQLIVIILYAIVSFGMALFVGYGKYSGGFDREVAENDIPANFVDHLLGGYIGSFIGALLMVRIVLGPLLNWITKTESSWAYIWKSTAALFATIVVIFALVLLGTWFVLQLPDLQLGGKKPEQFMMEFWKKTPAIVSTYNMLLITILLVMSFTWLFVLIPVALILSLIAIFRIAEFVTVRVVDSPKGPILGLIGLLTAIGALVKLIA